MSDAPIQPALKAEEWKDAIRDRAGMAAAMQRAWEPENLHALAALSLIYQPFGFTHEGLNALREMMSDAGETIDACSGTRKKKHWALLDLAQREVEKIAALLPPQEGG